MQSRATGAAASVLNPFLSANIRGEGVARETAEPSAAKCDQRPMHALGAAANEMSRPLRTLSRSKQCFGQRILKQIFSSTRNRIFYC